MGLWESAPGQGWPERFSGKPRSPSLQGAWRPTLDPLVELTLPMEPGGWMSRELDCSPWEPKWIGLGMAKCGITAVKSRERSPRSVSERGARRAWASHSWTVETPQLMLIIIIPALASPSFHPAGPCLAGRASPTSKSYWGGAGQGGRLLAAREHNTMVGVFPSETRERLNPGSRGRLSQGGN